MRILVVEIGSDGKPIYKDNSVDSISQFCMTNRGFVDSKCKDFYIGLFNNSPPQKNQFSAHTVFMLLPLLLGLKNLGYFRPLWI